jgi:hypothetical protein
MSNVKTEQLFNLIKALSKGEKRFFKLYVSRLGAVADKKFIILFDAIEKQKEYNETKILVREKALNPKQLPNLKTHLYFQLLKSLRLGNSNSLSSIKLLELIDYSRLLYSKCLYKECVKMIDKAKRMAITNDQSVFLLEILELEKLVISKTLDEGNEERVNNIIDETIKVTESIQNINIFSNLSLKLDSYYTKSGFVRNKKDLDKVTQFFNDSLPSYDFKKISFHEKLYLYKSYVSFYFFIQDFKLGYTYATKLVELFEKQPEMKALKPEMYIKALNSLLAAQNKLYKLKEFTETLKQLIAIKREKKIILTENLNLNLFKAIYIHEINRHFMLGEFKSGTRIVGALEHELHKIVTKLDKHSILLFYYKIACLYFGSGNYRVALTWLNKITNEREIALREDLHSFARILSLICHFELGNDDLVESYIKSTYRFFIKKGDLSLYQKHILDFLKRLLMESEIKNVKKRFVLLKDQMENLQKNKFEKRAFLYFDIISWLESKIEKRPVQAIIKEKALHKLKSVELV